MESDAKSSQVVSELCWIEPNSWLTCWCLRIAWCFVGSKHPPPQPPPQHWNWIQEPKRTAIHPWTLICRSSMWDRNNLLLCLSHFYFGIFCWCNIIIISMVIQRLPFLRDERSSLNSERLSFGHLTNSLSCNTLLGFLSF